MERHGLTTAPPPEPPERPEGVERSPQWPWWFAFVAFFAGYTGTGLLVTIGGAIAGVEDPDTPGFVVLGTLAQSAVLVGTAVLFASFVSKPRAWHFGLRRVPLGRGVGWAAVGIISFFTIAVAYSVLVPTDVDQGVAEDLGANRGTFGLVAAGVLVMVVAPVAEEFFFRGFFYRALRSRFSVVGAVIIDGVFFGAVHFPFEGADGLLLLPPLALLGFIFCLVYEKTGSLFPVIGMHAFNNSIAYAAQADGGWQVSVVVGPLVIAACVLAPRLFDRRPRTAPA